ncbi:expressed protein [Echinococcus multilocularis]|uniref:Expressed protein n=1 Tax=Echinococcus multilocularis TaxID=6211 RepID=A0A068Y7S6_ECHMU|nr:expressed protein [Echinococcus multilocularis]
MYCWSRYRYAYYPPPPYAYQSWWPGSGNGFYLPPQNNPFPGTTPPAVNPNLPLQNVPTQPLPLQPIN